ncbi:repressor of RNA polymerase III transcription [Echinococcus multilocularis]|uniref:Repressor of RNA polymerase III transcription MAF1 homolog n=1 Tax=Echinococcus multilocularis TaxID=6211 RepID=A0A068YC37_ECHMU|nr:repressor of RNA polymerase III transcription [Echinococcus multilocularis]
MKFLDNLELETLTVQLSRGSRRYALDVKLESYSCKMVTEEKRQFKELLARLEAEGLQESHLKLSSSRTLRGFRELTGETLDRETFKMSTSQAETDANPQSSSRSRTTSCCSEGDGADSQPKPPHPFISARELFCLMSTITLSFDSTYDFMNTSSEDFCLEPELAVVRNYISRLCSIYVDKYEALAPKLWNAIDVEILPHRCVIYSYKPNHSTDPYSGRSLASFNYFFFNRSLRRILFFSLCVQNEPPVEDLYEEDMQDLF